MYVLLLTSLLTMPLYPLNPTVQDTLPAHCLHVTIGAIGPDELVKTGPEVTLKDEFLIHHPILLRAAIEYRYGSITSRQYPNGHLQGVTVAASVLYYRGTNYMTGYLGAGLVYTMSQESMRSSVADSMYRNEGVTGVDLSSTPGYRFTFGLRYDKSVSLELTLTNTRPDFVKERAFSNLSMSRTSEPLKINDVRVTLGYIFRLSRH